MNKAMIMRLAAGGSVLIDVVPADDDDIGRISRAGDRLGEAGKTLTEALGGISAIGTDIMKAITALEPTPSQVAVTFGIDLTYEASIKIIKAGGGATFTVTLTWAGVGQ